MEQTKEDDALRLLREIKTMSFTLQSLQEQIARLYTSLTSTTIKIKEVDVQSSGDPDPIGNKMAEIIEYQEQILEYQRILCSKRKLALDIVKTMDMKYQSCIIEKYFNGKTIEEIGEIQDLSPRWAWELIHRAEEQFIDKYNSTT